MSTPSDHAFPMHLHCTPTLHNTICAYLHWVLKCVSSKSGQECCAFLQTQTLKSINFELRHSMEHGGYTGCCFGSGENPVTTIAYVSRPIPQGLGLTDVPAWGPQTVSVIMFPPWGGEGSLEFRCAVFQHAVSDIAGTKMRLIVTFFIKSINSPSNNLNAFSWPLLHIVPGERGKINH